LSLEIVISDASGTRVLGEQDLPLNIGTASESAIRVPGVVEHGYVAQIGMLDGRAFVQVPGQGEVTVNGENVTSIRWLQEGDELLVAGIGISWSITAERLTVDVDYRNVDYETIPPELGDGLQGDAEIITPVRSRTTKTQAPEVSASKQGRYLVYGLLAFLISAALYMFTAVTVVIEADQEHADISLPGSWLTPGGDGRYLLWPGEYAVLVEAPGFYPYEEALVVESGGRAEFNLKLKELPGRIVVEASPAAEGELWIDGQSAGLLPGTELLLDQGSYELRIKTPRFLEYIAMIEVAGRDQLQTIEAVLVPNWADATVMSEPVGAEIVVADEVLGVTPATVELIAGNRQVELRKPGYKIARRVVSVIAGQTTELPVFNLQEAGGFLQISSKPAGAAVNMQKKFEGNTPLELEVAKGRSYQITLSKAGYQTATRTVEVVDGTPVPVQVTLQPKMGKLSIVAEPADASLYVDGRLVGSASRDLDLIALPHRLEVRKEGFETWAAQVTPKPGLPQRLEVRLLTPQQAVIAAIPTTIKTVQGQALRLIEPGEFMLGAPRREQGRRPNEVRKSVQLTRWFYIGLQEVSNREFREFRSQHTSGAEKYRELAADNHPVVMLSWEDAAAYCNWLSDKEGLERAYIKEAGKFVLVDPLSTGYRLPTEAEWVWVARYNAGGGERKYPWGSGMPPPDDAGNYADRAAMDVATNTISSYNDSYPVTAPVGSFPPSPLGIYDLGGNVAEWVNDRYSVAAGSGARLIDPVGPGEGQYHVIRGSSWRQSSISELRLAYRDFGDRGRLDVGFRIARYAAKPD
jgi:formylglycine-generating enzyme required for sulfatase activity